MNVLKNHRMLCTAIRYFISSERKHNSFLIAKSKEGNKVNVSFAKHQIFRLTSTDNRIKCWNCGTDVHQRRNLFCETCNCLQKVSDDNYFNLLKIDYTYDVDVTVLSKMYKQLQSVLHPDKFSTKSKAEQVISEEYSSLVNKAYSALNNPIERGLYMLKLKGETIEGITETDDEFIASMIELNEQLGEYTTEKEFKIFENKNQHQMDQLFKELSECFQKNDIETAKEVLSKLKYFDRMKSKIREIKQSRAMNAFF